MQERPALHNAAQGDVMLRRGSLVSLLALVTVASLAFAQRPPGSGSTGGSTGGTGRPTGGSRPSIPTAPDFGRLETQRPSEVVIRVVYANERPGPEHVMVQLLSASGVPVGQGFTNSEGKVAFTNIPPGNYHVKVSGGDVQELTTDSFQVDRNDPMHMEWVHVQPKEGANNVGSTQAMVSAVDLKAPDKAKKELNKGNEAFIAGDMKKAEEHYKKATSAYPQFATAYNNLGAVYMRLENRASAREAFTKAAEADPNLASANANLARVNILDKQPQQAIPFLQRALAAAPNDAEFLMLMARAQLEAEHYDEAISYARKAHAQPHPKYPFVHLIAGQALQAENKPDEARIEYEIFIKEAPDAPQAAQVRNVIGQLAASAARPR